MKEHNPQKVESIRSVLIPAGSRYVLLPNAAVAEIISYQPPKPKPSAPGWLLGYLEWRELNIPVIAWERLVEGTEPDWSERDANKEKRRVRIAILNTLNGNPELSHIGILSIGNVKLISIRADIVQEDKDDTTTSQFVKASVFVDNQPAWVPDLDELERYTIDSLALFK